MMLPLNRYYSVEILKDEKETLVLMPSNTKKGFDKYTKVKVLNVPQDSKLDIRLDDHLVVYGHLIEEFEFGNVYFLVPESGVLGVLERTVTKG